MSLCASRPNMQGSLFNILPPPTQRVSACAPPPQEPAPMRSNKPFPLHMSTPSTTVSSLVRQFECATFYTGQRIDADLLSHVSNSRSRADLKLHAPIAATVEISVVAPIFHRHPQSHRVVTCHARRPFRPQRQAHCSTVTLTCSDKKQWDLRRRSEFAAVFPQKHTYKLLLIVL